AISCIYSAVFSQGTRPCHRLAIISTISATVAQLRPAAFKPRGRCHAAECIGERVEDEGEILAKRFRPGEDFAVVDVLAHVRPPWRAAAWSPDASRARRN